MDVDKEDAKSSKDQSGKDNEEMQQRKRALTRKLDRRLLPILSYVFDTY